jgi:hypothetical protein
MLKVNYSEFIQTITNVGLQWSAATLLSNSEVRLWERCFENIFPITEVSLSFSRGKTYLG